MQRSKVVAVAFYVGALLIGGVAGIAADRMYMAQVTERRVADVRSNRDRVAKDLGLTPDQRHAMDTIFDRARQQVYALAAPIRPQQDSILDAARATFRALLTEEQQALYDERNARRSRAPEDQ